MSGLIINRYAFGAGAPPAAACDTYGLVPPYQNSAYVSTNQLGWRFRANYEVNACSLRVWARNTDLHTLRLWRASDQTLLAEVDAAPTTADWVDVPLPSPVTLAAGATYVVSVRCPTNSAFRGDDEWFPTTLAVSYDTAVRDASDVYPATILTYIAAVDIVYADATPDPRPSWPGVTLVSASSTHSFNERIGYRAFTKANPLLVTHLRTFVRLAHTRRVIIHRVSDGAVIAQADILGIPNTWAEAAITPVTLEANTQYTFSSRYISGTNGMYRSSAHSLDYELVSRGTTNAQGILGGVNDSLPGTVVAIDSYIDAADFRYERET